SLVLIRLRRPSVCCDVCRVRLAGSYFQCPRCRQKLCGQSTCWSSKDLRCVVCQKHEVLLFPSDETWWRRRVGPRVRAGQCLKCLLPASQTTDLRECGQCHWPLCKRCWDLENGTCPKCGWIMSNLPKGLDGLLMQFGTKTK